MNEMDKRLECTFDQNLREFPCDPALFRECVNELQELLESSSDPQKQVSLLGEIGVHYRILNNLQDAENSILKALKIIENYKLGIKLEIQQKIRLAHVIQWKKNFEKSDKMYLEIIATCRSNIEAAMYLDFALQHAGKNFFDQNRFVEALNVFNEALGLRLQRQASKEQIESTALAIKRTTQIINEQ